MRIRSDKSRKPRSESNHPQPKLRSPAQNCLQSRTPAQNRLEGARRKAMRGAFSSEVRAQEEDSASSDESETGDLVAIDAKVRIPLLR